MRDKTAIAAISDQPTVSRRQAAILFNMGRDVFLRRWEEYFKFHIRHVSADTGLRLLLVDVIKVAYPEATDEIIYSMAYQYVKDSVEERRQKKADMRRANDEG